MKRKNSKGASYQPLAPGPLPFFLFLTGNGISFDIR